MSDKFKLPTNYQVTTDRGEMEVKLVSGGGILYNGIPIEFDATNKAKPVGTFEYRVYFDIKTGKIVKWEEKNRNKDIMNEKERLNEEFHNIMKNPLKERPRRPENKRFKLESYGSRNSESLLRLESLINKEGSVISDALVCKIKRCLDRLNKLIASPKSRREYKINEEIVNAITGKLVCFEDKSIMNVIHSYSFHKVNPKALLETDMVVDVLFGFLNEKIDSEFYKVVHFYNGDAYWYADLLATSVVRDYDKAYVFHKDEVPLKHAGAFKLSYLLDNVESETVITKIK